jgi:hypothetical protein
MKFALGIFQLGLGFLVTKIGFAMQLEGFLVPLWTLIFLYLLHTTGELFLSPIGLSMVTKLSPKHAAGTAMGGWFLSFAIANFLGGQIAALTGSEEHGSELDKNLKITVQQGLANEGNSEKFSNWPPLVEDGKVNITFGEYQELKEFVEFREALEEAPTFEQWSAAKSETELNGKQPITSLENWLQADNWIKLKERLAAIDASDKTILEEDANADVLDFGTWKYFFSDFSEQDYSPELTLGAAFSQHRNVIQEKSLKKYVGVFGNIGFVLLGFALLIALLNKPLKSLMHGVQ